MPRIYEARCLNCGNLGHFREECPRAECENCHSLGHTVLDCDRCLPAKAKFEPSGNVEDEDGSMAEDGKGSNGEDDGEYDDFLRLIGSKNDDDCTEDCTAEDDHSTSSGGGSFDGFLNFIKTDAPSPKIHLSAGGSQLGTKASDEKPIVDQPGKKEEGESSWRRPWWELQW
jgi:hypothetical protein